MKRSLNRGLLAALTVAGLCTATAEAVVVPKKEASLADKTYRADALYVPQARQSPGQLPALAGGLQDELAAMGVQSDGGYFDTRTGRWETLILARPMVPGTGVGNTLRWDDLGGIPASDAALQQAAWNAVRAFVQEHQGQLRVDLSELGTPNVGIFEQGNLIQMHADRVVNGISVRDSGLTAIINHGNLLLFGLRNWADVGTLSPGVSYDAARAVVSQHTSPLLATPAASGRLEYVPTLHDGAYDFRLVWVVATTVAGDMGSWEGLVDAVSGDLLAFEDRNLYATRRITGGVFPVSNDGRGPEGTEQLGWPMPFDRVTIGPNTITTTTGGTMGCTNTGAGTSALSGQFVRMSDGCGAINEPAAANTDFDLGASTGTDCVVPAGHSAGDTHSSRSGFYELNKLIEQARGYLPANAWLQAQLTSNMNIALPCNAFWNGSTVNFYRSAVASGCGNTGEIAAVFDHEWGHGLDDNGTDGTVSSPGESIADIHAILRLNNSCVGRGFRLTSTCGGYGDACNGTAANGCTGVRDSDFALHRCNLPHTVNWILNGFAAGCATGTPTAPACGANGSRGPCNRETHCEGQAVAEVAWDLKARDLPAAPFNMDNNTALELTTRLFYLGAETVSQWYSCAGSCQTTNTCGCGATNGYLLVLVADDDNGNLADGTPHGTAIKAAFDRHQMGCNTTPIITAGCATGPTTAPATLTATAAPAGDAVNLSWTAVANAASYNVYRTEGVAQCDFGKVKIANVAGTTYSDNSGLLSGRPYSYIVIPQGASSPACLGRASACATATPSAVTCGAVVTVSPIALAVDAGGNQVLQPNEAAVTVAPTWRNGGGAPVALTGALTNLTGPAGPTYTINDGAADYGTIPVATNQGCTNCYTVTVAAATRPIQHWDATALETMTPGAATKTWTLHVGDSFGDVLPSNLFYRFVEILLHKSVTGGCGGVNYCPSTATTRAQMSAFVLVSKEGAGYNPTACAPPNLFIDVPESHPFCKFIEELANRGVVAGCDLGMYCPDAPVARDQMAVFVLRTLDPTLNPPACTTPMFNDVAAADPFCKWIEELARRGTVTGCGGGAYCPHDPVTRDQMGVFLSLTFGLTLYGL